MPEFLDFVTLYVEDFDEINFRNVEISEDLFFDYLFEELPIWDSTGNPVVDSTGGEIA